MNPEIVQTGDNSHSLVSPQYGVTYHSIHGAITESLHVFIEAGFRYTASTRKLDTIKILEVGLGTGLNALLTYCESLDADINIEYDALEPFPVDIEIVDKLNYGSILGLSDYTRIFHQIHNSRPGMRSAIGSRFSYCLFKDRLQDLQATQISGYDLVYYDAFDPGAQPEMWDEQTLGRLAGFLNPSAILVTYCAQGQFKRHLRSLGFSVESIPGPPHKREMIRAIFG